MWVCKFTTKQRTREYKIYIQKTNIVSRTHLRTTDHESKVTSFSLIHGIVEGISRINQ